MTNQLLWIIAKLLVILIHCTYTKEKAYSVYSRRLNSLENDLTEIEQEFGL